MHTFRGYTFRPKAWASYTLAGPSEVLAQITGVGTAAAGGDATLIDVGAGAMVGQGDGAAGGIATLFAVGFVSGDGGAGGSGVGTIIPSQAFMTGADGAAARGWAQLSDIGVDNLIGVGGSAANGLGTMRANAYPSGEGGAAAGGTGELIDIFAPTLIGGEGGAAARGRSTLAPGMTGWGGAGADGIATLISLAFMTGVGPAAAGGISTLRDALAEPLVPDIAVTIEQVYVIDVATEVVYSTEASLIGDRYDS